MTTVSQFNNREVPQHSPFNLDNDQAYRLWREQKLAQYPGSAQELIVNVDNISALSSDEQAALTRVCAKANSVIYRSQTATADKRVIRALGEQLGLRHLDENICADGDGISGLQVMPAGSRHEGYIPYTDRPINWHTDGYYNMPEHTIRAMLLHCVSDAASGGDNAIMDHEMLYLLMRDQDPDMVRALMETDVMTIPANIENGVLIRQAQSGPVFSVDPVSGNLHMRYTARTRSIEWKDKDIVRQATVFMQDLFKQGHETIFQYRLGPGEGIISNNALHNRSAFVNDDAANKHRLFYRARYFDRVRGTDLQQIYRLGESTCCG